MSTSDPLPALPAFPAFPALPALPALPARNARSGAGALPCERHRLSDHFLSRHREIDHRRTAAPPGAAGRLEHVWIIAHECRLFLRRQRHHAARFVCVERRENLLAADAEVRMTHVRAFDGLIETERDSSEVFGLH